MRAKRLQPARLGRSPGTRRRGEAAAAGDSSVWVRWPGAWRRVPTPPRAGVPVVRPGVRPHGRSSAFPPTVIGTIGPPGPTRAGIESAPAATQWSATAISRRPGGHLTIPRRPGGHLMISRRPGALRVTSNPRGFRLVTRAEQKHARSDREIRFGVWSRSDFFSSCLPHWSAAHIFSARPPSPHSTRARTWTTRGR